MVGWWTRDVPKDMGKRELYTPCGPLPPPAPEHSWVLQSQKDYKDGGKNSEDNRLIKQNGSTVLNLPLVSPAWEKFQSNTNSDTSASSPSLMIPKGLDHRFFVWNAPNCFSDSLYDKDDCF